MHYSTLCFPLTEGPSLGVQSGKVWAAQAIMAGRQLKDESSATGCKCRAQLRTALPKVLAASWHRANFLLTLLHLRKTVLFRYSSQGTVTLADRVNTEGVWPFPLVTPAGTDDQAQLSNDCKKVNNSWRWAPEIPGGAITLLLLLGC